MARPNVDPLGEGLIAATEAVAAFDPKTHLLGFDSAPSRVLHMEDIDLPADTGISPVAVSEPFPLFSKSAIRAMRAEVFRDECWLNCRYSSNINACQLRGMCPS